MSDKTKINTYLLIQFNNEQLASEAHKCLENALELDFREIAHVNKVCLIMLPPDSDLTLDELADKVFKLPGVGKFDLHIARAGIKDNEQYFQEIGRFRNMDFKK